MCQALEVMVGDRSKVRVMTKATVMGKGKGTHIVRVRVRVRVGVRVRVRVRLNSNVHNSHG